MALVDVPNYVLQASTDLMSWQTLASPPVLTNGVLLFLDPYARNYAARYYRVVEQ